MRWSRLSAGIGQLRPCRIGEKWRRMRTRLQKNGIDDDDEARRNGAEDRQRIDRTVRNLRPKPKSDRCGGAGGAGCGTAHGLCGGGHALFFTRMSTFAAAIFALQRGACRRGRRALRPAGRQMRQPLRWRSARNAFLSRLARSQSSGRRTVTRVPSPTPAADGQLAAVQPHQALDDGKSEAGAAMAAVVRRARLEVGLADPRQILVADADAVVLDREDDARRFRARADRDLAAAVGEADRVRQEIEQNLVERALVGDHFGKIVGADLSSSTPASRARSARRSQQPAMTCAGREGLRRDLEIVGLDLRHVENAVDHRQQVVPGIVDEAGIFVAASGIERQHRFLHQHFRKADDGVERRAQFVAHGGEEAALGGIGALSLRARVLERLLLPLAFGHVAQHRDDFAAASSPASAVARSSGRQRISIHTNCVAGWPLASTILAPHAELDRAALSQGRGVAERGEIGGTVGDVDAVEQAMPMQFDDRATEQQFGGRRDEQHRAVAAMAGDHVGHVARQQPVTVLFGVEQPEARPRQRLGAEREPRRVERGGNDAERGERRVAAGARSAAADEQRRESPAGRRRRGRSVEAVATTRRDAESAASSGTTTSQMAAKEAMPPVEAATTVTNPVSASDDSTWALS